MTDRVSALETARQQFRARLLAAEGQATQAVVEGYVRTRARLQTQIDDLVEQITRNGITSPSQLYRLDRYRELIEQTNAELTRLGRAALPVITAAQEQLIGQAIEEARTMAILSAAETSDDLARATTRAWARLPVEALGELIGALSDGSPLAAWLDQFPAMVVTDIDDRLRLGLALGWHPRKIAAELGKVTDLGGSRLTLVTRQATLDAYRSAAFQQAQGNSNILEDWTWQSSHDSRTCLACIALSGQHFPLSQTFMGNHPGCRCNPRFNVKGANPSTRETGREWFDRQPDTVKRQMLPVSAWTPYRMGKIDLSDFIDQRDSARWGPSYHQKPVRDVLDGRAA
jgi:SPP1 gp7 family putative phage head morphogenesis protein